MTRKTKRIVRHLDPRSLYPRCDFCAKKDPVTKKTVPGTVQLGPWWAHAACAVDPENLALASVQRRW